MGGAICAPAGFSFRAVMSCPTCVRRRRMVVTLFLWYGPTVTCCACGESWNDGERSPRPFQRGWRAEESARARAAWAKAGTKAEAFEALHAEFLQERAS